MNYRILIPLIVISSVLKSQSFYRGAVVLDLNTGFEYYHTNNSYRFTSNNSMPDTTVRDVAGSGNVTLGFEVGIKKRIGLGLRGKSNTFFTNIDAVTHKRSDIRSTDLLLIFNIHPIIRKRFDLVLGTDLGFSMMQQSNDDLYNTFTRGNGGYIAFYLNPRFYWKRFGLNLKTYLPRVSYNNLKANETRAAEYMISKWKGSGVGVSVGIQFRFFKS